MNKKTALKAAVRAAILAHKATEKKLEQAIAAAFPVGSEVHWEKRGHMQHGRVLSNGCSDRLRVENSYTGAKYFITMYDIFGYVE